MAAAERLRQGVRALLSFSQTVDYTLAEAYLTPAQMALFRQMKRSEQLHSLNVLRMILTEPGQPETPHDLAVAALLHDVGKTRYPVAIWQKTLAVLVRGATPGVCARWSQGSPRNPIKRGCVVAAHHPTWSAELVAEVGASERALWLIAHHADEDATQHHKLLNRLRQADDAN